MDTSGELMSHVDPILLQWKNINYTVVKEDSGAAKLIKKCKGMEPERTELHILHNGNGVVEPGSMLAIMGPSGSGKTTMLNVLSGRLSKKKFEGEVLINGVPADRPMYQRVAGYVPQEDILSGNQTVREALNFYATLKLDSSVPVAQKNKLVEDIISELGLKKVSDSLIGYVGADAVTSGLKRGLSGGERKRLSIGLQLISNPSLLFLDEPTTGLDSFAAFSVVRTLSKLSQQGRTIIFTIHQPSAEIMNLFDKMMFIGHGRTVYFGPQTELLDYFSGIGYDCPPYENPGDYFMKIIHIKDPNKPTQGDGVTTEEEEEFFKKENYQVVATTTFEDRHKQAEFLSEQFAKSSLAAPLTQQLNVAVPPAIYHDKKRAAQKPGFFTQLSYLSHNQGSINPLWWSSLQQILTAGYCIMS